MMKLIDSRIMSIPGIGDTLGPMIPGEIGDADRFSSAKKLIAFAGLDPVVIRSENMSGPISKRGSPLLRKALFLVVSYDRPHNLISSYLIPNRYRRIRSI